MNTELQELMRKHLEADVPEIMTYFIEQSMLSERKSKAKYLDESGNLQYVDVYDRNEVIALEMELTKSSNNFDLLRLLLLKSKNMLPILNMAYNKHIYTNDGFIKEMLSHKWSQHIAEDMIYSGYASEELEKKLVTLKK